MTTTTIKFDSTATSAPRTFGLGIHRQTPAYRQVASATDEAAAEAMFREARMFDAAVERMAQESAALDRMERGLDAY